MTLSDSERIKLKSELMDVDRLELYADQTLRLDRLSIFDADKSSNHLFWIGGTFDGQQGYGSEWLGGLEKRLTDQEWRLNVCPQRFLITGPEHQVRLLIEEVLQKDLTDYDIYKLWIYFTVWKRKAMSFIQPKAQLFKKF